MSERRTVLIAMDSSEHSEYAYQWYLKNIHRADDFGILIHISDFDFMYPATNISLANPAVRKQMEKELEQKTQEFVTNLESLLRDSKVEGKVVCIHGAPEQAIIEASKEYKVDMIVTGCRGAGQIHRAIIGSVSDYVLHHSDVPVIVCKHPKKS